MEPEAPQPQANDRPKAKRASKADAINDMKAQLAEAEYELEAAKASRAEAERIVRDRSKAIADLKTRLIEALTQ
jgi:hypothetical protein